MEALVAMAAVALIKLTAMIAGYKIVALGHDTLVRGLKGEFVFTGHVSKDRGVALKSASPGLLFVLLGSLLIGWSVYVDKPIQWNNRQDQSQEPKIKSTLDLPKDSAR